MGSFALAATLLVVVVMVAVMMNLQAQIIIDSQGIKRTSEDSLVVHEYTPFEVVFGDELSLYFYEHLFLRNFTTTRPRLCVHSRLGCESENDQITIIDNTLAHSG